MSNDCFPDITYPIRCRIVSWSLLRNHTVCPLLSLLEMIVQEYVIEVERGLGDAGPWRVSRRYSDWLALNERLAPFAAPLVLPPKKMIGNTKKAFVQQRSTKLQVVVVSSCSRLSI
jgi:hypothetical protein